MDISFSTNVQRQFSGERTFFSSNGTGTNGYPYVKSINIYLSPHIKTNSK